MRELKPYRTLRGLQAAIDNGGRFYNLLSRADDGTVTGGELAKAAGTFESGLHAFLFLEMAQQELSSDDRQSVLKLLDAALREKYRQYRPQTLLPSAVERDGSAGAPLIVTGFPQFIEDRTQFRGLMMIPTGKSLMMIPIFDKFDVYEVFDDQQMRKPGTMVATVRGQRLSHSGPIRFGGVLRPLELEDKIQTAHKFYLETIFYTKL